MLGTFGCTDLKQNFFSVFSTKLVRNNDIIYFKTLEILLKRSTKYLKYIPFLHLFPLVEPDRVNLVNDIQTLYYRE